MEQAGYNSITFYELNDISITYNGSDEITNVTTSGNTITLYDYDFNNISVDYDFINSENNDVLLDIKIKFQYNKLSPDNLTNVDKLMNSIYGFSAKLVRKNGTEWFINTPFKFEGDETNTNESHEIKLTMKSQTKKSFEKFA